MKNTFKNNASKFIMSHAKLCALFTAALCGLVLLFLSGEFAKDGDNIGTEISESSELDAYRLTLEKSLTETISTIQGAGQTNVMITLESSFETVYASNAKLDETSTDFDKTQKITEKQLATTSSRSDGETPVVVKRLTPKISGVLIVCTGGENKQIKQDIINAASTALNISSSRIYVTGGNFSP